MATTSIKTGRFFDLNYFNSGFSSCQSSHQTRHSGSHYHHIGRYGFFDLSGRDRRRRNFKRRRCCRLFGYCRPRHFSHFFRACFSVRPMDAICGGQVEVLVEWIDCEDHRTVTVIQGLQDAIKQHRKAWLVTNFQEANTGTTHTFIQPDGRVTGDLPQGMMVEAIIKTRLPGLVQLDQQLVMIEPIDISGSAYIFCAGHVSRSLAVFAKAVGFWTVVLDDRGEYANRERFPDVDQVIVLESFSNCLANLKIDGDSFIVIVTRGHMDDLTVIAQALKTEAGYIGMIGSRRKCALIFEELRRNGFREEDIQRVHAPIGLPISAETPEEIGISIVAEMIQERSKLQNFTG